MELWAWHASLQLVWYWRRECAIYNTDCNDVYIYLLRKSVSITFGGYISEKMECDQIEPIWLHRGHVRTLLLYRGQFRNKCPKYKFIEIKIAVKSPGCDHRSITPMFVTPTAPSCIDNSWRSTTLSWPKKLTSSTANLEWCHVHFIRDSYSTFVRRVIGQHVKLLNYIYDDLEIFHIMSWWLEHASWELLHPITVCGTGFCVCETFRGVYGIYTKCACNYTSPMDVLPSEYRIKLVIVGVPRITFTSQRGFSARVLQDLWLVVHVVFGAID